MTRRLTSSSLAGISRKLVAVGTARLASMLLTIRAAAPLRATPAGSAGFSAFALAGSVFSGSAFFSGSAGFSACGAGASASGAASGAGAAAGAPLALLVL